MIKIQFKTDNDAFVDDRSGSVAAILRNIAGKIETGEIEGKVFDVNGNSIGDWSALDSFDN